MDDKAIRLICGDKIRHDQNVFFAAPLLPSDRIITCLYFLCARPPGGDPLMPVRSIENKAIRLICGDKIKHDQTVFFAYPLLPSDRIISCLYFVQRWSTWRRSPDAGVIDDTCVLLVFSRVNACSRSIDDKAVLLIGGEKIKHDQTVFFASPLLPSDRIISCLYFVYRWSTRRRSPDAGVIDDRWVLPVFSRVNSRSRSIDDKAIRLICGEEISRSIDDKDILLICGDKIKHDQTVFFASPLLPSDRIISCLYFVYRWSTRRRSPDAGVIDDRWVLPVFSRVNSRSRSIDDKAIRLICGEEISRSIDDKDILLICGDKIKHDQTVFFASPLLPSDRIISCLYFVYRWSTRRRSPDAGVIDDRWVLPVFSRVNSRSRSIDDKAIRLICGEEISRSIDDKDILLICGDKIKHDQTVFFASPLLPSDQIISCLYFVYRWSTRRRSPDAGVIDDRWVLPVFSRVNSRSRSIDDKAIQLICGEEIRYDKTVFFAAPLLPSDRVISCLYFVQRWSVWRRSPIGGVIDDTWMLPVFPSVNACSRSIDDKAVLLICGDKIRHDRTVFFDAPLLPSARIISCLYFV
ncbi:hypothetical protein V5799_028812 [Amblyomma americanum]|uniref:Uncharacterized protein n=1 Tax=Amblyomma americanum TaxID=6943 RepID=A0AAQ4DBS5_AMBAM